MHGRGVHRLPVPDLLPQFGVLAAQFVDVLAQLEDFATKLPHQFGQTNQLGGRERVDKGGVHNTNACNPDLPSMKGPSARQKRVRRSGTTLAAWLLNLDRDEELARLLERYDEPTAMWAYPQALLSFRQRGDTPEARRRLERAQKANRHVPAYLLG